MNPSESDLDITRRTFCQLSALAPLVPLACSNFGEGATVNDVHSQLNETRVRRVVKPDSSSALRISNQYSDVRCFELDRAGMQCIKQSLPDPIHHNTELVPADLEETSLDRELRDLATFDTGSRTVFVVEGVSMYLDERTVRSLLDSIASLAGPARQDLLLTFMDGRPGSCSFHNATALADWWLEMSGEPFRWGCPRGELASFLDKSGLVLRDLQDHETLRARCPAVCRLLRSVSGP